MGSGVTRHMGTTVLVTALVVLSAALVLFFLVDRFLLWAERRGWVYYRKAKGAAGIGVGLFQELSPAAQAVKRSMEQETFRKDVRPSTDPPFGVDLEAGTVRLPFPAGSPPREPGASGNVRTETGRQHHANRGRPI